MTVRLLVDENFPAPALRLLREGGIDVKSAQEAMPGAPDDMVLACARAEARWLVTYDRDYGELIFSRGLTPPPAILLLRQEPYPPSRPAEILLAFLEEPSLADGFFVSIGEKSVRRRALPKVEP